MKIQAKTPGKICSAIFALGTLSVPSLASADVNGDALYDMLAGGKVHLNARLRFENVDQDSTADDSNAFTIRTRLGYETGKLAGFGGFLEFEDTTAIGNDENYLAPGPFGNGVTGRPVVADPEFTELNQAFISYSGIADTVVKFGRQRIILDNSRYIGNVGWRQNEQTFDGLTLNNNSLSDTSLTYAFITNQNTIVGANADVDVHAFNASYSGFSAGKLTGYAYLSDFDSANANDNRTSGVSFTGSSPVGQNKIIYAAEYAQQSDSDDNTADFDHDYTFLEGGLTFGPGITAKIGYESLGSDNGTTAFFTPFATLHKFQGWADVFLGTGGPTAFGGGVEDLIFTVTGKVGKVKLLAAYHDFGVDDSSVVGFSDYGSEIDLLAATKLGKFNVGAKYASFSSDTATISDIDKFWLWVETKI